MSDDDADAPDTPGSEVRFAPSAVHMLRTTTTLNLAHSQMADQKASMLMGATFVVFTITVGQASRGHAPMPLLVLGGFAFISALFAVAVVMPKVRSRREVEQRPNPMFFGSIAQLDCEDYIESVLAGITTEEAVFRIMLRNIWQNGQVLAAKKYRLLGWAYRTFLAGLVISAVLLAAGMVG